MVIPLSAGVSELTAHLADGNDTVGIRGPASYPCHPRHPWSRRLWNVATQHGDRGRRGESTGASESGPATPRTKCAFQGRSRRWDPIAAHCWINGIWTLQNTDFPDIGRRLEGGWYRSQAFTLSRDDAKIFLRRCGSDHIGAPKTRGVGGDVDPGWTREG